MSAMRYERSGHPPIEVSAGLREVGQAIRTARLRRRQTAADVAARVGVSLPTFRKLERGDPTVSLGTLATAAWIFGLLPALQDALRPEKDGVAAAMEASRLPRRARKPREMSLNDL